MYLTLRKILYCLLCIAKKCFEVSSQKIIKECISICYKEVKIDVMRSGDGAMYGLCCVTPVQNHPVSFTQLFSDKAVRLFKTTAAVAYFLHAIFLKLARRKRQRLVGKGHTIVQLLPVEFQLGKKGIKRKRRGLENVGLGTDINDDEGF